MADLPTIIPPSQVPAQPATTINVIHNPLPSPGGTVPIQGGPAVTQSGSTGAVLQPAAPIVPAAPNPAPTGQNGVPGGTPAPKPAPQPLTDQFGKPAVDTSGQSFGFGNPPPQPQTQTPADSNQTIAAGAGTAGLSFDDLQKIASANAALSPEEIGNIRDSLGIPATQSAAFAPLSKGTVQFYQDAYNQAGLGDLKSRIMELADKIKTVQDEYTTAAGQTNENPFLSEASRVGEASRLQDKAQASLSNLINEQNQLKDIYTQGLTEVNGLVTKYTNDFQTNRDQAVAKLNYLTSYSEKLATSAQNVKAQKVYKYLPQYLKNYGQTVSSKTTIGSPQTGYYKYNPDTQTFEQVTPPGGVFTPITTPLGDVGTLNTTTGQETFNGGVGSPATLNGDNGIIQLNGGNGGQINIPQNVQPNGGPQLAFQNNNPGNLMYAGQTGAIKGAGGFAKFATPQDGYNALIKQVQLDQSRGLTLGQYVTKYAPPSSNNTAQYIQQAIQSLGASADTPLASIDASKVAQFQAQKESGTQIGGQSQQPSQSTQRVDPQQLQQLTTAYSNLASTMSDTSSRLFLRQTLQSFLAKGDTQGAWDYLKTQAINHLDATEQTAYKTNSDGIASFQQGLTILSNHPELSTGPYKDIIENAKPWVGQNKDQDYANFRQAIDVGATAIRHGFFGARLTDTEVKLSQNFLPDPNDTPSNVTNKLKGAIGFYQYVNDKTLAQKLGTPPPALQDYLTAAGYQQ
jgi:hypothetical protein